MWLSPYGKREWLGILLAAVVLSAGVVWAGVAWAVVPIAVLALALLAFFRDPPRTIPTERGLMVSPADGLVSSVHEVAEFPPLGEPAVCVRIFLSVLDVHVNRSPCHGQVSDITPKAGKYLNALNPQSAEVNASNLIVLVNPGTKKPVAAVRQVAGLIARGIVCGVQKGDIVQRGQHIGMIRFGSTTELYVPKSAKPEVHVKVGQQVRGGSTVLVKLMGEPR